MHDRAQPRRALEHPAADSRTALAREQDLDLGEKPLRTLVREGVEWPRVPQLAELP
jgi:hypothetical protein